MFLLSDWLYATSQTYTKIDFVVHSELEQKGVRGILEKMEAVNKELAIIPSSRGPKSQYRKRAVSITQFDLK